jgi:predicted nucleotidyltransferase
MGSINAADWSAAAVERAAVSFGENLLGVAAFGSWARGELAGGSDVDLLIVLESSVPITRSLYRDWDERSVTESPRKLDPHFVHLPALYGRIGAVWAEAAVDGIVLFERGFRLSSTLVRVRHEILEGRLVRKIVHGQPYWTEVA